MKNFIYLFFALLISTNNTFAGDTKIDISSQTTTKKTSECPIIKMENYHAYNNKSLIMVFDPAGFTNIYRLCTDSCEGYTTTDTEAKLYTCSYGSWKPTEKCIEKKTDVHNKFNSEYIFFGMDNYNNLVGYKCAGDCIGRKFNQNNYKKAYNGGKEYDNETWECVKGGFWNHYKEKIEEKPKQKKIKTKQKTKPEQPEQPDNLPSYDSGSEEKINKIKEKILKIQNNFKTSVWKDKDGNFNKHRLLSDSIAGVVLGTAGGLITSTVMKKVQVKNGYEDISCVINGQSVASYGDEFVVGVK